MKDQIKKNKISKSSANFVNKIKRRTLSQNNVKNIKKFLHIKIIIFFII